MPEPRHLLSIADLDVATTSSGSSRPPARSTACRTTTAPRSCPRCAGRLVITLFYESSTRTSSSFELAAKRLSADDDVDQVRGLLGGEGRVAEGHGADARGLRAGRDRRPAPARRGALARRPLERRGSRERGRRDASASDAGAPRPLHDARAFGRLDGLHVAIVGDVLHSRVARSLIQALGLVGADVTLVGPPTLVPRALEALGCERSSEISAIESADVVYVLRMQRERMLAGANYVPSLREYAARWGVTPERLRPGQKVMHPGR